MSQALNQTHSNEHLVGVDIGHIAPPSTTGMDEEVVERRRTGVNLFCFVFN